jgi:hypothetical protein
LTPAEYCIQFIEGRRRRRPEEDHRDDLRYPRHTRQRARDAPAGPRSGLGGPGTQGRPPCAAVEVRREAEEHWAEQIKTRAGELPKVDLGCAPDSIMDVIRSGYPGGPIEYMRICRGWLEDGFARDLILARPPHPSTAK